MSAAPSMMSLRQRHIDPQLAIGSQRFVESSHVAGGHQGEGSSYPPSWPRSNLRQSHGQVDTLGLTVSHPSVFYTSSPSYSSSSSSSFSSSAPHSSFYPSSFQPMDPIPDSPPRRSRSYGYSCLCTLPGMIAMRFTKLVPLNSSCFLIFQTFKHHACVLIFHHVFALY